MGHEGKEGSEVTVKARGVVPTPARYAAPAVSIGMGYGYAEPVSPRRDGMPGSSAGGVREQVWSYVPAQLGQGQGQARSPTQPVQVPSRSPTRQVQGQPLSRSPPKSRSPAQPAGPRPPPSRSPARPALNQQAPATPPKDQPPITPPKQGAYSPTRAVPMPVPTSGSPLGLAGVQGLGTPPGRGVQSGRGGFGEADDPLARHAAELMRGVNGSPGAPMPGAFAYLDLAPLFVADDLGTGCDVAFSGAHEVGTPGTIRIHADGEELPAPADGMWRAAEEEPGELRF